MCAFCGLALIIFFVRILPPSAQAQADVDVVRVATKEIEPFVIRDGENLAGFSIDLWREIALFAEIPFEFVEVESVDDLLEALEQGEADVAIAAISMTPEREAYIDFSYPYFQAGLQILTAPEEQNRLISILKIMVSPHVLTVIGFMVLLLIIIGHIVWLVERTTNDDFPQTYFRGIWEGIWWASVTVTTVGYGDRTLKGVLGRLLGIFWMFSGILLIANFTAVVTSELTLSQLQTPINSVNDLPGRKVATVKDTTSAEYLRLRQISYQPTETIHEAFDLLDEGKVEAIVYDAPVLQYHVATNPNDGLLLIGSPFHHEDYGIALPPNSPYEEIINQALLELRENGTYAELAHRWSLHVGSR